MQVNLPALTEIQDYSSVKILEDVVSMFTLISFPCLSPIESRRTYGSKE